MPLLERVAEQVRAALGARDALRLRARRRGRLLGQLLHRRGRVLGDAAARALRAAVRPAVAGLGRGAARARARRRLRSSPRTSPGRSPRCTRAAQRLGRGQAHRAARRGRRRASCAAVAAAFNRMASDLESMERERAMVLAGISHDLRTPLSRLRLALEMSGAEATPRGHDRRHRGDRRHHRPVPRFRARRRRGRRTSSDLTDAAATSSRSITRASARTCRVHDRADAAPFRFARMAVRRAVANLVDNALRYAGEPVEIETSRQRRQPSSIEVRDRGPRHPGRRGRAPEAPVHAPRRLAQRRRRLGPRPRDRRAHRARARRRARAPAARGARPRRAADVLSTR